MASKFDGKRAGENFWVMQQNLAKQKGGRKPHWFQQPRPKKIAKGATSPASVNEEKKEAAASGSVAAPPEASVSPEAPPTKE